MSLHGMGASVTVVGRRERGGRPERSHRRDPARLLAAGEVPPAAVALSVGRPAHPSRRRALSRRRDALRALPVARLLWPRARFVYDVHEDFGNLMMIRDWLPRPLKPGIRLLTEAFEKGLARLAHGIVAVTPPLADRFPHRHRVVAYNYVTPDFFEQAGRAAPGRPPSDSTISSTWAL